MNFYQTFIKNNNLFRSILIILLTTFVFILLYEFVYDGTIPVKSTIDNKYYKVRRGADMLTKSNNLAIINIKLNYLVNSLKEDLLNNKTTIPKNKIEDVNRLIYNWGDGIDIKEIGNFESDAAYVLNKRNMSFCLRASPMGGQLEDINILTYVAIHEISHIMSIETGHGDEFTNNMIYLLNYSKTLKPTDSRIVPFYIDINNTDDNSNFCGVEINGSPT